MFESVDFWFFKDFAKIRSKVPQIQEIGNRLLRFNAAASKIYAVKRNFLVFLTLEMIDLLILKKINNC